jgi:hypothetical protein
MHKTKKTFITAVVAVTAAMTLISAGSAQADPGKDQPTRAAAARADSDGPPDRVAGATPPAAARAALAAIQKRIARHVARHGTTNTFGSYLDTTGTIVIETDASTDVVSGLTDLAGAPGDQRAAARQARVRRTTTGDTWHRRDDIRPYWGGGGIRSGGALCSSGYAVQNGAGTRFSVTAGHCFANGATVLTESGANTYGTVSNRRLPTVTGHAQDMELVGGQSYAGRIFTGGVTSTSSLPVVAAGAAYVGYTDYCHSGRTTGEQCGHTATSITGQVCTQTGCKSPVIVYTGGNIQQGGDSGGPFYAKTSTAVWIRGHVIASSSTTGYVQPWTVVASSLGVNIVTG